jgi:TatD DNase family protein
MLVDTHCHLTHERYDGDRASVLSRAREAGVGNVVSIASHLEDAAAIRALMDASDASVPETFTATALFGTAGIHPHHAASAGEDLRSRLEDALDSDPRVVAVGECGLDFHYDLSPRDVQRRVFELQLRVAGDRGLPAVVHCREAEEEMIPIVKEAGSGGVTGVLHCFPGHRALLDAALESGWLVSFTGLVTFPKWGGTESVHAVPADRYMLETDGPFMAPVPHRGKRNEPAFVPWIRDRVAELRGEPAAEVARRTTETALRFFGLPLPGEEEAAPPPEPGAVE